MAAAVEASSLALNCTSASSSLVALICFSSSSISGSRACQRQAQFRSISVLRKGQRKSQLLFQQLLS